MKKLIRVIGARPQLMQVKPVWEKLDSMGFDQVLVHTGQHYSDELSGNLFRQLGLTPPKYNLEVGSGSHSEMTAKIMIAFEKVLIKEKADGVIVDGDTNSTLAASLSAAKLNIPIFHIESGTRDKDKRRPEEVNRILTDHLASLCFAPTEKAMVNLTLENLEANSHYVGDVLLDTYIDSCQSMNEALLDRFEIQSNEFNYMTLHRPENTDLEAEKRFLSILKFVDSLKLKTLYPVHPRVDNLLQKVTSEHNFRNIRFIEPLSYYDSLTMSRNANWVFTDSGGVSREAVWSGAKTIMIFKKLTWSEFVENDLAHIALGETENLEPVLSELYSKDLIVDTEKAFSLFGAGKASEKISKLIKDFYER
ncbi:MAG: UDP-N-acetylglucosamine 2-epimerase (non-hydrolyzing) [Halobacteriovoraceae bacterium]|nr:UDP-N-acetylglucosamine 2-epimerase (non-hydrolyzing) [Halobacteriovoraceae bacterium]|tara:strand:+ start:6863 stop:7954 length:1092 start_codon:yes stop_codon:yes gene_type:complete